MDDDDRQTFSPKGFHQSGFPVGLMQIMRASAGDFKRDSQMNESEKRNQRRQYSETARERLQDASDSVEAVLDGLRALLDCEAATAGAPMVEAMLRQMIGWRYQIAYGIQPGDWTLMINRLRDASILEAGDRSILKQLQRGRPVSTSEGMQLCWRLWEGIPAASFEGESNGRTETNEPMPNEPTVEIDVVLDGRVVDTMRFRDQTARVCDLLARQGLQTVVRRLVE